MPLPQNFIVKTHKKYSITHNTQNFVIHKWTFTSQKLFEAVQDKKYTTHKNMIMAHKEKIDEWGGVVD